MGSRVELDINASSYRNLTERLQGLHDHLLEIAPDVERVACALYDDEEDLLKTFINSTRNGEVLKAHQYRLSDSESLSHLARTRELRLLTNIQDTLEPTTAHSAYVLGEGFESSFTVPMYHQGDFLGFIFFDSRKPDTFPPALQRAHAGVQLRQADGSRLLLVDAHAQLLVRAHDDLHHLRGALLGAAHAGQVHHARGDERGAHHEDDEQHQHHVDEGDHVDLVHRGPAPGAASGDHARHGAYLPWGAGAGAGAPALRCRMLLNSSMKVSSWIATRSMSRAKRL